MHHIFKEIIINENLNFSEDQHFKQTLISNLPSGVSMRLSRCRSPTPNRYVMTQ